MSLRFVLQEGMRWPANTDRVLAQQ